jgi:hypothetical protein
MFVRNAGKILVSLKDFNFPYHWVVISENNPFGGGLKIHYCVKLAEIVFMVFCIKF